MRLLSSTLAISKNNTVPFLAVEGVPPYTYSVVPGPKAAGGTIQPNGLYIAPDKYGADVIRVTDSSPTPQVVEATIAILHPLELVCDIIRKEMNLAPDQVFIYQQKYNLPKDSRIRIAVGVLTPRPFGSKNKTEARGSELVEVVSVNMHSTLSIRVFSRSDEALYRKEEILMAFNSTYAKNQMSANSFYIAKLTNNFVNLGQEEGAAILYEFDLSVGLQYAVSKVTPIEYFDKFLEPELIY